MQDYYLMFLTSTAVTTTTTTPVALDVGKTAADGIDAIIAVTTVVGSTTGLTLICTIEECDTTNGTWVTNVTFPTISATGRYMRRVQSKRRYLRMPRTVGAGTGASFTMEAGLSSGPQRDHTA